VICTTETWLSELVFDKEILPSHYAIYHKDRGSCGGRVLVAVDESIPHSLIIDSPPNLEFIVVQLRLTYPIVLCTVYIPPNSSDLFETLIPFLTDIVSSNTPCFIVPDITTEVKYNCKSMEQNKIMPGLWEVSTLNRI